MSEDIDRRLADRAQRGHPRGADAVLAAARREVHRHRRRQRATAAAVVTVAFVGVAMGVAQLAGDGTGSGLAVTGPTSVPATPPPFPIPSSTEPPPTLPAISTTPTTHTTEVEMSRRLPGGPGRVVVLTEGGDLVELSTEDASIRRVITSLGVPQGSWSTVELAQDGSIWVGVDQQVLRVDPTTGASTVVAEGMEPRVSPDGRYLAYAAERSNACFVSAVVVRDLQTGDEHTWRRPPVQGADLLRCVASLSWAPDGSVLIFTLGWESTSVVFAIDPQADRSLPIDAHLVGPPVDSQVNWRNPMFTADASTVVVQEMVPDASDGGYGLGRVLRVDLTTGETAEEPDRGGHIQVTAYDASGHALVIESTADGHHRLVHRDSSGNEAVLAVNVVAADW